MDDKQFQTARNNEQSPAPGFASVNTHNPTEEDTANNERDMKEGEAAFDVEDAKRKEDNKDATLGQRMPTD